MMDNRYLNMARSRRQPTAFQITGKAILGFIGIAGMLAATMFWYPVQSTLSGGQMIPTISYTLLLVLAPPALWSFLLPFSPGGMLLQRIHSRTYGFLAILACAFFLLWYEAQILWSWWAAQPVVADTGLVWHQVLIGLIGYVILPGLVWSPVSGEELVEKVRQDHLVKKYQLETQGELAILQATLLRAQEKAIIGFANLTIEERGELAAVFRSLVGGIDDTLAKMGATVNAVSGTHMQFDNLIHGNEDVREVLNYIEDSLTGRQLEDGADQYINFQIGGKTYRNQKVLRWEGANPVVQGTEGDMLIYAKELV